MIKYAQNKKTGIRYAIMHNVEVGSVQLRALNACQDVRYIDIDELLAKYMIGVSLHSLDVQQVIKKPRFRRYGKGE